jgi:hypothetical protein
VISRLEQDIKSEIGGWPFVRMQTNLINDNICAYVRARIRESNDFKRLQSKPKVQDEIKRRLMEKVDRI